jgi:hypothetical protein
LRAIRFIKRQGTRDFNTTGGFVEDTIAMSVSGVTKKDTFINFRCKLRAFGILVKNEALTTKNSKVRDVRLFTDKELISGLVAELVKIQTVDSMTSCVDCFHLKTIRSLVLIKHGSCGFNETSILPLHYPILLWSIWDGELVANAIVTSYSLDLHIKFILGSYGKLLEYFMNFALVFHK